MITHLSSVKITSRDIIIPSVDRCVPFAIALDYEGRVPSFNIFLPNLPDENKLTKDSFTT